MMYPNGSSREADRPNSRAPATELPLPDSAHLLQALAGRSAGTLPLECWARELSDMHAQLIPFQLRRQTPRTGLLREQVHEGIHDLVNKIDAWATQVIPRAKSARKHTHSLGEVISHIAWLYAEAWWTILHSASAECRHQAWFHLGEACEAYVEMVDEIRAHHLQLPLGWGGIRTGIGSDREGDPVGYHLGPQSSYDTDGAPDYQVR